MEKGGGKQEKAGSTPTQGSCMGAGASQTSPGSREERESSRMNTKYWLSVSCQNVSQNLWLVPPKTTEMAGGAPTLSWSAWDGQLAQKWKVLQPEEWEFYCCCWDLKGNGCSSFPHTFLSSLPSWNQRTKGHVPWNTNTSAHFNSF